MKNKKRLIVSGFFGFLLGFVLMIAITFLTKSFHAKYIWYILLIIIGPPLMASFITNSFLIQNIILIAYFIIISILFGRTKKKVLLCLTIIMLHIFSAVVVIYDFEQFAKGIDKIDWRSVMQEWTK